VRQSVGGLRMGLYMKTMCSVLAVLIMSVAVAKPPVIYDTKADGMRQIATALAQAKAENKRVLLQLGANWCIWCVKFHELVKSDAVIAGQIQQGFVLVPIDVDGDHNRAVDAHYGFPTEKGGLPSFVLLDKDGTWLTTVFTEHFDKGPDYDRKKVEAFFKKWALK
jgi:thiol:disulfide interchange protein